MVGPYLQLREKLGPAVQGARGAIVGRPSCSLVPRSSPVSGQDTLTYWQGFRVPTEQGMGCVSAPAPASHWEGRTWDWDMSWD